MKTFEIEHIGFAVTDPVAMANWYQDILGLRILFSGDDGEKAVGFIKDDISGFILEIGKLPGINPVCKDLTNHLQLHIAFKSDDPKSDADYLVAHGATFIEECHVVLSGDYLIILYDPWGNCIQLSKRDEGRNL